jgi:LysR family transcriptional regulator, regulator for metE and metH
MIDIKHLNTLMALQQCGSLVKAAQRLFTSQSALSHQLKELESRLNCQLFERKTQPILFTRQGHLLLELAENILPMVADVEKQLVQPSEGVQQTKTIGIECHACFQWLLPGIREFNQGEDDFQLEILSESLFDGQQAILNSDIVMLFSDQLPVVTRIHSEKLADFEVVLLVDNNHPLAQKSYVSASDLLNERLLTYPLEIERLDIFRDLLLPAQCKPRSIKQVDNTNTMMQMVAAGMGVASLPNWAISSYVKQGLLSAVRLGEVGIHRSLYVHCLHANLDLIRQFVALVKPQFLQLE